MTLSLLLAAYILSPSHPDGHSPAMTTGDMLTDWQKYAATAESIVVDEIPTLNILASWHKLGVKVFQRIAWNPDDSADFIRRKAGGMAVQAGADGIWLVDEKNFTKEWTDALAEAKADVEAMRYLLELADRALAMRAQNHKIWIEGRRAKWFVTDLLKCEEENPDVVRIECSEYARRLEQLLGVKTPKKLKPVSAKPAESPKAAPPLRPLEGKDVQPVAVSLWTESKLSDEVSFKSGGTHFTINIASKTPCMDAKHPGGQSRLRLYVADGKGSYLPYEFVIDLSLVATNRAPEPGTFITERWGKGEHFVWGQRGTWRFRSVRHRVPGMSCPELSPGFRYLRDEKTGKWSVEIAFSWAELFGYWPSVRNGSRDKWFFSLDALSGVSPVAVQMNWAKGSEANFSKIADWWKAKLLYERWASVRGRAVGPYGFSVSDRLYGFLKTEKPTYNRLDADSDKIFRERILQPMLDEVDSMADIAYVNETDRRVPRLDKLPLAGKLKFWKSMHKLFDFAERVDAARREYLLMRLEGKIPPEPPPKKQQEEDAASSAPNADIDDGAIQLDDELEF